MLLIFGSPARATCLCLCAGHTSQTSRIPRRIYYIYSLHLCPIAHTHTHFVTRCARRLIHISQIYANRNNTAPLGGTHPAKRYTGAQPLGRRLTCIGWFAESLKNNTLHFHANAGEETANGVEGEPFISTHLHTRSKHTQKHTTARTHTLVCFAVAAMTTHL